MARKGGMNKFLEFIGLVDDEEPRQAAGYSDGYGRPSTYVPQQQRSRTEETRRKTVVRDERPRYETSSRYGSTRVPTRTSASSGTRSSSRYDYQPRPSATSSRFGSYDPEPREPRTERASARTARSRTMMCQLTSLEDCCDVIDSLIAGNVVVLTLDELEPKLVQRALDTLSGAVFALSATIRKASDKTYVIAPSTAELNESYDAERRYR